MQAEAYSKERYHCEHCKHDFQATVATWVDVSRTPQVKTLLQRWEFNSITCPHCGNRQFSGSPFFYEDFAEGLLVAVFPSIPANRLSLEEEIRQKYGYYPTLEFFYDMSQLWFLVYLQEHYQESKNPQTAWKTGKEEKRLQRFLRFLKMDPLMLTISETLMETFLGNKTNEDLQDILWCALAKIEGESTGPRDAAVYAGLMRE
jgi:hypothetical protein